ncbi:MAG: Ig-like domain-containing protein [Myxococcales bacterium]|nr:Ig-like domain-containing protein [Myxococcota bacterium]MDW8282785.1 Ig-like domain-containing protein [Myxococcales bacterium]
MRHQIQLLPWALFAAVVGGGCGPNDLDVPTVEVEGGEPDARRDVVVPIQRQGRASGLEVAAAGAFAPGGPPLRVYLNREGATLTGGSDDSSQNRSSIVNGRATIPRFRGTDATWNKIRDCVRDEFARFNVTVTDQRPASGPYVMAMFGGNGSELGYGRGIGGVAPIDPNDCTVIEGAVVYIFSDNLGINDWELNCEVGAHEVGHALSLDHELLPPDPMTYLAYNGLQTFQDQDARCGEYSARACVCRRPSQNTVKVLASKVGWRMGEPPPPPPPGSEPTVSIKSPADGAVLPAFSTIQIVVEATDNDGVSKVELLWKYNGAVFPCPGTYCTQSGSTYTYSLYVGSGERRFQVRATDRTGLVATTPERVIYLQDKNPGDVISIRVLEPMQGQQIRAGSMVKVTAEVTGSRPIAQVGMTWSGAWGSVTDSLVPEGGTRWGRTIHVSPNAPAGPRQITVFAQDVDGGRATAAPVVVHVTR